MSDPKETLRVRNARRRLLLQRLLPRELLDASAPAILQVFESTYDNLEQRSADVFQAGFGGVWIPPTGRADSGNQSVGYDAYNRFDLGGPAAPTLYGSETGLKALVDALHTADVDVYADFVVNHNGFRDSSTPGFVAEGGYPGFALTLNAGNNSLGFDAIDGDFHGGFETGDLNGRLSGLIDIAHETDFQFIRQPVEENALNIPGGPIANSPDPGNARFYPDTSLDPILLFDPKTGESDIAVYPYNLQEPLAGDATTENALGYLMRNARWLIETIGIDGLRVDAAKHVEPFVLEFLDRAVYRAIAEPQLDGSTQHPFLFLEVFTGDRGQIQNLIRKDIDPGDPGRIGGNRDALDFPLHFAMRDYLTGNGIVNDWREIKNASQDIQDDGLANNGSQGVAYVNSHDEFGPFLSNVAHAYVLMRPGNAIVYLNAKQFGDGRDFPKDGRGDALGGLFGDQLTRLVNLRNTHGRGNYIDRTPVADEKEMLIFERSASSVVLLSNRLDSGFDSRTIQTNFLPGTPLVELTGNASDPTFDPFNDFPEVVVVKTDGTIDVRVPRNTAPDGTQHNSGYLIYGASGPQTSLSLSNVDSTLAGGTPTNETNGTTRLNEISVITADSFEVTLNTAAVNHLGSIRDTFADGDNALLKIDDGLDVNQNGSVDNTSVGGPVTGFEEFLTFKQPGFFQTDGQGLYRQVVDTTTLAEGMHFLETRAFRHREVGEGDAIYTSDRRAIYIDRLPPESEIVSFEPREEGVSENRDLLVRLADATGNNVHVLWDLPAALSDGDVLALIDGDSQGNRLDRDLFVSGVEGLTHGNHVATLVTFEMTGNVNVQRFPGLFTSTIFGAGLGDLDFDGGVDADDVALMQAVFNSNNAEFNPAADFNGDGLVDVEDLALFYELLVGTGNTGPTFAAFDNFVVQDAPVDFGDAPETYSTTFAADGPRHLVTVSPILGASADTDTDGQPANDFTGDDGDGNDDENGLVNLEPLVVGESADLTVNVSGDGRLDAWIDFDGNGVFDHPAEHIAGGASMVLQDGDNVVGVSVPAGADVGGTAMRLRVSRLGGLLPTGLGGAGEIEDYGVEILTRPMVESIVLNDGAEQRSNLTSIEVVFDRVVNAPEAAFGLTQRETESTVTGLQFATRIESQRSIVRITFSADPMVLERPTGNSLVDGNYELSIDGAQVLGTANNTPMSGDVVFGDEAADGFFRWFGDSDGDRDVDGQDLGRLSLTFFLTDADAAFNADFDRDGDGDVDGQDYGAFSTRLFQPFGF
ncbi:MAG: GEVED domain-containing protein [Planctomycetota bacterium]